LFGQFAANHLATLNDDQLGRYEALLDEPDHEVLAWIYGRAPLPARHDHDVFGLLRAFEPRV
jgi:antitoxin CptB